MAAGSVFLRLARKSPCSVLVIPDKALAHLNRALVMIDGSEHSKLALSTALAIVRASRADKPQVLAQSVYTVGYGYGYAGMSFAEAVANMEARTRERLQPILDEVDTSGVDFELILSYADNISQAAYDLATARHMDFIVVGSKGTTIVPSAFLGGVGEQVVAGSPAPALIVKKKGETVRFLDVLLGTDD